VKGFQVRTRSRRPCCSILHPQSATYPTRQSTLFTRLRFGTESFRIGGIFLWHLFESRLSSSMSRFSPHIQFFPKYDFHAARFFNARCRWKKGFLACATFVSRMSSEDPSRWKIVKFVVGRLLSLWMAKDKVEQLKSRMLLARQSAARQSIDSKTGHQTGDSRLRDASNV
jgi:hypothetical protein